MNTLTQIKPSEQLGGSLKKPTYQERLLAQKIQLLEIALRASIKAPNLENMSNTAKAKHDLLVFMRGDA
ncbi:hypothetical protein SKM57_11225 [Acinetobacter faecalis]|uniref:hypothetical protein n=1 Tax=Acinetobacter TaxID=469 RepID=UPI0013D68F8F|nr:MULTISPECIES: hypothetical protein [Acinetobacter]MDY6469151.1 hypothetical protein [Acinetobacter faecalis]